MSSTFDTLCHALRTISTRDNLTTRQKDILSYVLDLTEEMHSANHRLDDVINKDLDVSLAARRLRIVLDTEDPELQRQKLLQTYKGGKP